MGREVASSTGEWTRYAVTVNSGELGFPCLSGQAGQAQIVTGLWAHTVPCLTLTVAMSHEVAENTNVSTLESGLLTEIKAGFLQAHRHIFIN